MHTRTLLMGVVLFFASSSSGTADDQPQVRALIKRAVDAMGGREKFSQFKAARWEAADLGVGNKTAVGIMTKNYAQFPDQLRVEWWISDRATPIIVITAEEAARQLAAGVVDAGEAAETFKKKLWLLPWQPFRLVLQGDKEVKGELVDDLVVNGRSLAGCRLRYRGRAVRLLAYRLGTQPKEEPIEATTLYFDKKTGLLEKSEYTYKHQYERQRHKAEDIYADYKSISGVLLPMRFDKLVDGKQVGVYTIAKIELLKETLDPNLFKMP